MEWLESLKGHTIGIDTAVFIYAFEENEKYLPLVRPIFEAIDQGKIEAITSTITLLEVLVHPFNQNNQELAQQYREILLNARGLTTLSITPEISERAARIRSGSNIRTPDAIQLAAALNAGATHFITNDSRLPDIPGIIILVLDKLGSILLLSILGKRSLWTYRFHPLCLRNVSIVNTLCYV